MRNKNLFFTEESLDHILVFKTNIQTEKDKVLVSDLLNDNDSILEWSVDMEDRDCVLRVVSYQLKNSDIIELIKQKGYSCTELE